MERRKEAVVRDERASIRNKRGWQKNRWTSVEGRMDEGEGVLQMTPMMEGRKIWWSQRLNIMKMDKCPD